MQQAATQRTVQEVASSLMSVPDHVVRPSQTAFMQGRNILDGVAILDETVHELHRKKLNVIILKIDFEKAYDKVKWSFLQQTLRMKGFSTEWHALINSFVSGGSVAIKVNDDTGKYFQTKKGLRQGDPLSPILFNIVADMLAILIERAAEMSAVGSASEGCEEEEDEFYVPLFMGKERARLAEPSRTIS